MTAEQYRSAINRLGLSQAGAATLVGVEPRTSRRWSDGSRTVPEPVARFLRLLIAAKITPDQAHDLLD